MKKETIKFLSSDKKTLIFGIKWIPDGEISGILQISHGVTEYIMRYEKIAEYFTRRGILVCGIDDLGHGNSISSIENKMYFGPADSWQWVVEDLGCFQQMMKKQYPDLPYALLGFSLGSFLVRAYLTTYSNEIDTCILVGTGEHSLIETKIARIIAQRESKKHGDNNPTPLIHSMTFGIYNQKFKPNKTEFDWLCKSEQSLREYEQDSMKGNQFTAGLFRELLGCMDYVRKRRSYQKVKKDLPILLLSGTMDPVGNFQKGVYKVYKKYRKNGIKKIHVKFYENLRHDILHEEEYEDICEDIYQWIVKTTDFICKNRFFVL